MIVAIILFSIAIANLIWSIIITAVTEKGEWLLGLILSVFLSIIGAVTIFETPTNSDVKEGRAYYVEQNHVEVLNGDTVNNYKTYEIIWNQNTK